MAEGGEKRAIPGRIQRRNRVRLKLSRRGEVRSPGNNSAARVCRQTPAERRTFFKSNRPWVTPPSPCRHGRSPGSRVFAPRRLPGPGIRNSGLVARHSPMTVAGAAPAGARAVPDSLFTFPAKAMPGMPHECFPSLSTPARRVRRVVPAVEPRGVPSKPAVLDHTGVWPEGLRTSVRAPYRQSGSVPCPRGNVASARRGVKAGADLG